MSLHRSSGAKYNKMWYAALAFVTLVLFSMAVGAMVFMIRFYTHPDACFLNRLFLGVNCGLCFIVSLLAISPCIQTCEFTKLLGDLLFVLKSRCLFHVRQTSLFIVPGAGAFPMCVQAGEFYTISYHGFLLNRPTLKKVKLSKQVI